MSAQNNAPSKRRSWLQRQVPIYSGMPLLGLALAHSFPHGWYEWSGGAALAGLFLYAWGATGDS